MEISRRRIVAGVSGNSKSEVTLEQILELEKVEVPEADPKFAGCKGVSVRALMGAAKSGTGVFTARDGMETEQVQGHNFL